MTLPTALAAPVEDGIMLHPVNNELGGRAGVHGGHETLLDAVGVVDDLGQRREAVGRARRVGDDVRGALVVHVVHPHDVRPGDLGRVAVVEELD